MGHDIEMKSGTPYTTTKIKAWDIQEGDTLIIDRSGRPATITVAQVHKYWGGEEQVTVTTPDGAVIEYEEESPGGEEGFNEFGRIQRIDVDATAKLISDSYLLDELVTPREKTYGRSWRSTGHYSDDEDTDISKKQRKVLARVLTALREQDHKPQPVATISATVADAIEAEIIRGRKAMGDIAERLAELAKHPRFPKSTAHYFGWAIDLARSAVDGDAAWVSEDQYRTPYSWPDKHRMLLAQDWAEANGIVIDDGPQIPVADIRGIMQSLRILRATASNIAWKASEPLSIQSIVKPLARDLRAVIAELRAIEGAEVEQG
jgi:hypothetical protein